MRYKNVTKGIQKFRALDEKMIERVYEVKPDEQIEVGREIHWKGMEEIKSKGGK